MTQLQYEDADKRRSKDDVMLLGRGRKSEILHVPVGSPNMSSKTKEETVIHTCDSEGCRQRKRGLGESLHHGSDIIPSVYG